MIVEKMLDDNLVLHYSDQKMMMLQVETGLEYPEAVDVFPCRYTYVETDKPIEDDGHETESYDF